MRENTTKRRLREGAVLGCWSRYGDATLIEYVGYQGWDFVVIDGEHGTLEPRDCENAVRAAELRNVTPLVRVTTNRNLDDPARYMDRGPRAHVPMVNTAREAEQAVRAIKYGPRGSRGLAASRSADFGQVGSYADYVASANKGTLVVVQIETTEAVAATPAILAGVGRRRRVPRSATDFLPGPVHGQTRRDVKPSRPAGSRGGDGIGNRARCSCGQCSRGGNLAQPRSAASR